MKKKVLVIVGPTAVGKTDLSLKLAKQFNGEIISGDSMQVYKHLTIGTAKITPDQMCGIPHHLIDFLDVTQTYSASDFKKMAQHCIDDICSRGKLPIIVGGTGLYIEGLLYDMTFGGNNSVDTHIRQTLQNRLQTKGVEVLWQELYRLDEQAALNIPLNNSRRIIRALEVIQSTGRLFSQQEEKIDEVHQRYNAKVIGLTDERVKLYERINQRVDEMVEQGLLDEANWLLQQPNVMLLQASQAIGYKELFPFLNGEVPLDEALELLKRNSRRYAKRQLTWFRNRMQVEWLHLGEDNVENVGNEVEKWLKK